MIRRSLSAAVIFEEVCTVVTLLLHLGTEVRPADKILFTVHHDLDRRFKSVRDEDPHLPLCIGGEVTQEPGAG
jgi:hypothetical protein